MFSTTIDKISCFWVLIRWKWVIIFQSLIPSGTWDFFWFLKTPSLILNYSQLKLGNFLIFWRPPPPIWTVSQIFPLFSLESFPNPIIKKNCFIATGVKKVSPLYLRGKIIHYILVIGGFMFIGITTILNYIKTTEQLGFFVPPCEQEYLF